MNAPRRRCYFRYGQTAWPLFALLVNLAACVPLGMTLPSDDVPPDPEGGRIKPSVGWLTTTLGETATGSPDGSVAIEVVHIGGRTLLQQVRRFRIAGAAYGDSILLDRTSLRPLATWRWTPAGTYVTRYNHREVERIFRPAKGGGERRSVETLEVEPYSALGMELLVASLPLGEGYHGLIPVSVDTAVRGWSWLRIDVQREMSVRERPDQRDRETWIVDCNIGSARTRLWIAMDGRSVRKIERLGPDNEVLGVIRRMLLSIPPGIKHDAAGSGQ